MPPYRFFRNLTLPHDNFREVTELPEENQTRGHALSMLSNLVAVAGSDQEVKELDPDAFEPFSIRIVLHGFYAGHHFDGALRGGTGEFFFVSLATNGEVVHDVTSLGLGTGGVFEKINPGEWVDTGNFLLWPNTTGSAEPSATESITLSFSLLERDDADVANKLLKGLSGVAKAILSASAGPGAGANPAFQQGHTAILQIAEVLIGIDAANDHAISVVKGFIGPWSNYNVGRFVILRGHNNTYAILSVIPKSPTGWTATAEENILDNTQNPTRVKLPSPDAERLVSIFARPHFYYPGIPRSRVTLVNTGDSFEPRTPDYRSYTLRSTDEDEVKVTVKGVIPTDLKILVTKKGKGGAA